MKVTVCLRATRDEWTESTLQSKCNYKSPTLTIVKLGNYVFGGNATESWDGKYTQIR